MSKHHKPKRNLLIIGNGHDLSLNLKSSFNNYIGINNVSDLQNDELSYKPIFDFIKLFHQSQKCMMYKIRMIMQKFNLRLTPIFLLDKLGRFIKIPMHISKKDGHFEQTLKHSCYVNRGYGFDHHLHSEAYFFKDKNGELQLDKNGNPLGRSYVRLTSDRIAHDYFVLKLFFNKYYKITKQSFSHINGEMLDPFNHYDSLTDSLYRLNEWADKRTDKLRKVADVTRTNQANKKTDFWNLLLLFEMYIDLKVHKDQHSHDDTEAFFPKTWYDVENTIKEYLISIINQPIKGDTRNKNYKLIRGYHSLNHYIDGVDSISSRHFNLFTCINRYINLLHDVDANGISGGCYSSYKNERYIESFPLYKVIMQDSDYNDVLIHYTGQSVNAIGDSFNLLAPFMFLMLNKFGDSYINGDKSLFDFLHKQLKNFDNDFSYYLKGQIGRINNYKDKSLSHLKDLSVTSDLKSHNPSFSVLDFNYTPLSNSIKHYEHIHGSLKNGHIVIGIGEQTINRLRPKISDRMYNYLYSFTKTYQLFLFNKQADNGFLDNIKNVIFFGHSFGVNDFPYFEALFDHFRIYSNHHINLIFVYCGHGNTSYEEAKMELVPSIVSLLKDYSRSLLRSHSDNLIAKMFMENRIKLYRVNFKEKNK